MKHLAFPAFALVAAVLAGAYCLSIGYNPWLVGVYESLVWVALVVYERRQSRSSAAPR